ncbi:MAG: hypothetical protein KDA20_03980 [Phycisphaerales bacterium]|nr:hypothetical protein [Phycisphaerales bacterium]
MNTQDLLEQASLDALGLLDEQERQAFETAFRAAPPAVQSQVRREQARFAASEAMLPKVDVPAGLKFRVMAAVREAIQSFNRVETARRAEHTPFLRSLMWNSTPLWRAACIGFATATVTLAVFFSFVSERVKQIEATGTTITSIGEQAMLSPEYSTFKLNGGSIEHRFMHRVVQAAAARAVIEINPDSGEAHMIVKNLPVIGADYALVAKGARDGEYKEIAKFQALSTTNMFRADMDPEIEPGSLGILGPAVEGGTSVLIMSVG